MERSRVTRLGGIYVFRPLFFLSLAASTVWGMTMVARAMPVPFPDVLANAGTFFAVSAFMLLPAMLNAVLGFLIVDHYRWSIPVAGFFCCTILLSSLGGGWLNAIFGLVVVALLAWMVVLAALHREELQRFPKDMSSAK